MKNITGVVATEGNVSTDTAVECGFDPSGIGHIMSILSNMYSNSYLACLREYSCNARDSHIEAGQTRPIEVTLPSHLQPSLLIRDFGTGLSKQGIMDVFGEYGVSTKRDTNDQVGAFGIGSKAAFTLGQQFVVTGVKDGRKTTVLFALNEQNVGTKNVLRESDTDEPDGVLISLAVPDVSRMQETAKAFFSTWTPGTVLVNGEQPESVFDTGYSINESVHLIPERSGVEVIMGAVGYPVSRDILRKVSRELSEENSPAASIASNLASWGGSSAVYITVQIGDVDIAPSREALRDTSRTIAAVKAAVEDIARDIVTDVENKVNAATSWYEAMVVFAEAKQNTKGFTVSFDHVQWQGHALTDTKIDLPYMHWHMKSYRSRTENLTTNHGGDGKGLAITLDRLPGIMVVTDAPDVSSVSRIARRVIVDNGVRLLLISTESKGGADWFQFGGEHKQVRTVTFDEFKQMNKSLLAAEKKDRPKNLPSYDTQRGPASTVKEYRTPLSEILDEGKDLIVFDENTTAYHSWMFDEAVEDRTLIVLLATQSMDALKRYVNGEVEVIYGPPEVRRIAKEAVDAMDDEQRKVYHASRWLTQYRNNGWEDVEKHYSDRLGEIKHEKFKEILAEAPTHRAVYEAGKRDLERVLVAARLIGHQMGDQSIKIPEVSKKFPLLPTRFWYSDDNKRQIRHGIFYLNGIALSQ